jgi:hypothetical protein
MRTRPEIFFLIVVLIYKIVNAVRLAMSAGEIWIHPKETKINFRLPMSGMTRKITLAVLSEHRSFAVGLGLSFVEWLRMTTWVGLHQVIMCSFNV